MEVLVPPPGQQQMQASPPLIPIKLTDQEISQIIKAIPSPGGVGKNAVATARKHFVKRLRTVLKTIKLVPLADAFNKFKTQIRYSFLESMIEQGIPAGVIAGVSLGGPITQLSLNSFHFAGALSGVALAFQKVRDFLTGSRMTRDPQMKIFFKKVSDMYPGTTLHNTLHTGTFESIIALKPSFEQITVKDLVELDGGVEYLSQEQAVVLGVRNLLDFHARIRPQRIPYPNKYSMSHVVSLKLNTYRMFTHGITMKMVADALEGPTNPVDAVITVWKSQLVGRIYILADETRDYGKNTISPTMAVPMFLRNLVSRFSNFIVSGIPVIINIEPQPIGVINAIYQVAPHDQTDKYRVYTNNFKTRWEGISLADLHNLFTKAGYNVDPELNTDYLYITVNYQGDNLMDDLRARINNAEKLKNPERTPEQKALLDASKLHVGLTRGSNMDEIVWRDDVDLYRTTGNHSHEIADTLGIDAAQLYMIMRFRQMFTDFGTAINPRHISLVFNLLCNLGIINSLSFTGINRRQLGALEMASYEKGAEVMMNAAKFGQRDTVDGVSPSVYLGQPSSRVGTGSYQIVEDPLLISKTKPGLPSIDEISILEELSEERLIPSFEDLFRADIEITQSILGGINKESLENGITILTDPTIMPGSNTLLPNRPELIMASSTVVDVIKNMAVGTGYEPIERQRSRVIPVDIELPDISSLEDLEGLVLMPAQRQRPEEPVNIMDSMKSFVLPVAETIPSPDFVESSAFSMPFDLPSVEEFIIPTSPAPTLTPVMLTPKPVFVGRAPAAVIPPPKLSRKPRPPNMIPTISVAASTAPVVNGTITLPDLPMVNEVAPTQRVVQKTSGAAFEELLRSLRK